MRHSFVSQWIDNCSHHLGWWSGPQTQSHSFASKQHTILSITHFQVKQLSDKTKFSWNPLTHHPLGYVLLCYGGQLVQEHCLPLRQMWNLQENTQKLLMSNKLWGNICQCNLCVASSIKKKVSKGKKWKPFPNGDNLSLLTYAWAGTVDTKVDAGVEGCLRRKTGKGVSSCT